MQCPQSSSYYGSVDVFDFVMRSIRSIEEASALLEVALY